jgi:hypothetical protein
MSADEGEMFFLDNWIFASDDGDQQSETLDFNNISISATSPLRRHAGKSTTWDSPLRFLPRAALFARDFKCPAGTNDCSSIGAKDSCCSAGSTCINIQDTGLGSVGCCPNGQSCAGTISCDAENGYTSCPESPNGGCCLPGYSCEDVGCKSTYS